MKAWFHLAALACVLGTSSLARSQLPVGPPPTTATQAARDRSSGDMLLRHYAWTTMIQLFNGSTLAQQVIFQQNYLPNGRLNKVAVHREHSALPEGQVSQAQSDYLSDLRDQIDLYRPTAGAVMNFLTAAKVTGPDSSGALIASGKNVISKGDSVTVWLDATTKALRRIEVTTIFRDDPIQVEATYASLPDAGPTYLQYVQVQIPSKHSHLFLHNYDYVKTNKD